MTAPSAEEGVPVVAAVVRRDRAYLVARRGPTGNHPGRWEFPGGKAREGESLADALARELAEELGVGLEVAGDPLFTARDPGRPYRIYFLPARITGEPRAREHAELRWLRAEELPSLELAPADRAFVERCLHSVPSPRHGAGGAPPCPDPESRPS